MKNLILSSLLLILLIIGCSENNSIEPITYTDSELKAKIIGTWSSDYLTFNFDASGNFKETFNYYYQDTVIQEAEIIKGTYDIRDGILMYTNITEWTINNTFPNKIRESNEALNRTSSNTFDAGKTSFVLNNEIGVIYSVPNYKILINKDLLYFYPLDILTGIGENTNSLWGEWTTFQWSIGYDTEIPNYVFGKLDWEFNFIKDSMMVTYGSKLSMDSSGVFHYTTEPLVYNPPDLSWGTNYSKTIEFHNGQIYMYEKLSSTPIPLKKN
ncbi:MAG: hypothetical protein IH618_11030 [Ignavibacteriaceae bacterium]|nr:hypothetical protein [Ignavibacteriaceae bacterium]